MGVSIQDLLLRVRGEDDDAQKSLEELGRELQSIDRTEAEATLDLDESAVTRKLKDARSEMAAFARETAEAKADVDTEAARLKLAGFQRVLDTVDRKTITPEANLQLASAYREIAGLNHTLDKIDRREITVDVDLRKDLVSRFTALATSSDKVGSSFSKTEARTISLSHGLNLVQGAIGLLKWPALITGAGFAARALSAVVGGVVALGATLVPAAVGGLAAYAAGMLAVRQAILTIKIAQLDKIAEAINGDKDAMKELAGPARRFAEQLSGLKGRFDDLRASVQAHLFRGLAPDVKDALGNFGLLRQAMNGTADVINRLAKRAAELIGSREFGHLFSRITEENASVIGHLGDAALALAPALLKVLDSARPLIEWIFKGVEAWAKNTAAMVDAKRESGDLTKFFGFAKNALAEIVAIAGDVGHALFNIGSIGRSSGMELLKFLGNAAEKFREWTESASGQNKLKHYFDSIVPPLKETFRLVGDVIVQFFKLGKGSDLTGLIHSIRTELVPVLADLVKGTTKAFGPKLINLLIEFSKLLLRMAGSSGPLSLYVDALALLAKVLNRIFDTMPGVQTATVDLLAAFALYKTLAGPLGMLKSLGVTLGIVSAETTGLTIAQRIGATASALWYAAQRIAIEVMYAYRLAVIAAGTATRLAVASTGIGALILVAVLIATHWKQTKAVLAAAWGWIKNAAITAGKWIWNHSYIFGLAAIPIEIGKRWRLIVGALKSVWGWIENAAKNLGRAAKWALDHGLVGPVPVIIAKWGDVKDFFGDVWGWIKDRARDVWGKIHDFIIDPIRDVAQFFRDIWDKITGVFVDAWDAIKGKAGPKMDAIRDALLSPLRAVKDAAKDIWGKIESAAVDSWNFLRGKAADVWDAIKGHITGPVRDVRNALSDVWGFIKDRASDVWGSIRSTAHDAWDKIKDAILAPIRVARQVLGDIFGFIKDRIKNVVDWVKDKLGFVTDLYGKISGVVDKIKGALESIPGGGGFGIPGPGDEFLDLITGPNVLKALSADVSGQVTARVAGLPRALAGTGTAATGRSSVGGIATRKTSIHAPITIAPLGPGEYPDADSLAAQLDMKLRARGL